MVFIKCSIKILYFVTVFKDYLLIIGAVHLSVSEMAERSPGSKSVFNAPPDSLIDNVSPSSHPDNLPFISDQSSSLSVTIDQPSSLPILGDQPTSLPVTRNQPTSWSLMGDQPSSLPVTASQVYNQTGIKDDHFGSAMFCQNG